MSCVPGRGDCPLGQTCGLDGKTKGRCIPSSIVNFTGNVSFSSLPPCMQAAITASSQNKQTQVQDAIMGSLGSGIQDVLLKQSGCKNPDGTPLTVPYCQQEKYMNTSYCACRNIAVPDAPCVYRPCSVDPYAYKSTQQMPQVTDAGKNCPKSIVCNTIAMVGGNSNVTSAYQNINCGGTNIDETSKSPLGEHPWLLVLIFVLVVMLAVTLFSSGGDASRKLPAGMSPPGLGDFPSL